MKKFIFICFMLIIIFYGWNNHVPQTNAILVKESALYSEPLLSSNKTLILSGNSEIKIMKTLCDFGYIKYKYNSQDYYGWVLMENVKFK